MNIFRSLAAENRELIHYPSELSARLNGTPQFDSWSPVKVKLVACDQLGRRLIRSQCPSPYTSSFLVFRKEAAERLKGFLSSTGELLTLDCDDADLYAWHPLAVVDAVDLAASEVWRFADGRVMDIRAYSFLPDRLKGIEAFKIPNLLPSPIFFSESAVMSISRVVRGDPEFHVT